MWVWLWWRWWWTHYPTVWQQRLPGGHFTLSSSSGIYHTGARHLHPHPRPAQAAPETPGIAHCFWLLAPGLQRRAPKTPLVFATAGGLGSVLAPVLSPTPWYSEVESRRAFLACLLQVRPHLRSSDPLAGVRLPTPLRGWLRKGQTTEP